MPLATLYFICLQRIRRFLEKGMWKSCLVSPFSDLPSKNVDDLMELCLFDDNNIWTENSAVFDNVILLATSGRLTRIDLMAFDLLREYNLIVNVTQTRSSISMQEFASHSKKEFAYHLVRSIISWNPCLEEFHSYNDPVFDVLLKCPNLRIIKLYFSTLNPPNNISIDLSKVSSLRKLEILYVSNMDSDTIAKVLDLCPKLISIGLLDSLDSMEKIGQSRLRNSLLSSDVGKHFQMRRCVWGRKFCFENDSERQVYHSSFCEKMKFAVNLCPLVQELIFFVHVRESMKELRFLKRLTLLKICFDKCEVDFIRDFLALIREMGPQLKHLYIKGEFRYPENSGLTVNLICDCCPNLESLELDSVNFDPLVSSELSRNLPLKRLNLNSISKPNESLLLLLSSCKNLEELYLWNIGDDYLDDARLSQIFQQNHFTKLKVMYSEDCIETKEGYEMFRKNASLIEKILVELKDGSYFYDASSSVKDQNIHYFNPFISYGRFRDIFTCRLDAKYF